LFDEDLQRRHIAVARIVGGSVRVEEPGRGELGEEPAQRNLRASGEPAPGHEVARGHAARELLLEPEVVDEAEDGLDREAIEVLRAEDELSGEERADRRVLDPGQERVEVLGALGHGEDSSAAPVPLRATLSSRST